VRELERKKHCFIVGIIVIMVLLCFGGCTEEESSSVIEIEIESFYSFETVGYFTVDGIQIENYSIDMFGTRTFSVNKSMLPKQQYHNVTIYAESGEQMTNASCDKVTKSVKFVLSVNFILNCLNYE
jgi:hypothetical protein